MSCADYVNITVWTPTYAPNGTLISNVSSIVTNIVGAARRCKGNSIPLQVLKCRYLDEELIAPIVEEKSVLISSRVSWMYQDLQCDNPVNDDTACVKLYSPQTSTQKYHTVSPEYFEIMFDHEAFTPTNGVTGHQLDAPDAPLTFVDGRVFYPAQINPAGNGSFFRNDDKPWIPGYYNILGRHSISVQTLLEAAGISSLDQPAMGLFDSGSTLRYTGVTVMLRIIYNNYQPFFFTTDEKPSYGYEATQGNTYAAVHAVSRQFNSTTRLFENRHGIKVVVTHEGQLAAFTLVNLMFFIGGAVATLTLASLVVDNIVIRFFLPVKVKQILELASQTEVPVREDLDAYFKAVEENLGGTYEPPVTFWEVEKEWLDREEAAGKRSKRPDFTKTAVNSLEKLVDQEARKRGISDSKSDVELAAVGALAFARSISQPGSGPQSTNLTPTLAYSHSTSKGSHPGDLPESRRLARERWKRAKAGVLAQVRSRRRQTASLAAMSHHSTTNDSTSSSRLQITVSTSYQPLE